VTPEGEVPPILTVGQLEEIEARRGGRSGTAEVPLEMLDSDKFREERV
jgi:hypothetical protein